MDYMINLHPSSATFAGVKPINDSNSPATGYSPATKKAIVVGLANFTGIILFSLTVANYLEGSLSYEHAVGIAGATILATIVVVRVARRYFQEHSRITIGFTPPTTSNNNNNNVNGGSKIDELNDDDNAVSTNGSGSSSTRGIDIEELSDDDDAVSTNGSDSSSAAGTDDEEENAMDSQNQTHVSQAQYDNMAAYLMALNNS